MDARGVSETMAYIYILSIITVAMVIVYVQADSMIGDTRIAVISLGLEESFRKVEYVIHSVAFGETPSQTLELRMRGGVLELNATKPEFMIVVANDTLTTTNSMACEPLRRACVNLTTGEHYPSTTCTGKYDRAACVFNVTAGSIEYGYGKLRISVEGGGVFSTSDTSDTSENSERVAMNPRIMMDTGIGNVRVITASIPVVRGNVSFSGEGILRLKVEEGRNEVLFKNVNWDNFTSIHVFVRGATFPKGWCLGLNASLEGEFEDKLHNPLYCGGKSNCTCGDYAVHVVRGNRGDALNLFISVRRVSIEGIG